MMKRAALNGQFFQIGDQQWGGSLRCDRQLEPLQSLDLHRKACETKILQALRVSGPSSCLLEKVYNPTKNGCFFDGYNLFGNQPVD